MHHLHDMNDWRDVWAKHNLGPMISTHPLILFQAGQILQGRAELEAAEGAFREVLVRDPNHVGALRWLTVLVQNRRDFAEASEFRRRRIVVEIDQLELEGEAREEAISFKMAAEEDVLPPLKAPERYVAAYFDSVASFYDDHMRGPLQYREPELVHEAVQQTITPRQSDLGILDIGCGTGLLAPLLRPLARRLDGVDLSVNMLAEAQKRGLYDDLKRAEATEAMLARPETYDLIVAADVMPWFGDLEPVFIAAARALRSGGRFAFTIERNPDPGYTLFPVGHFAHDLDYLREQAQLASLQEVHVENVILRHEAQLPVEGHAVVLGRA